MSSDVFVLFSHKYIISRNSSSFKVTGQNCCRHSRKMCYLSFWLMHAINRQALAFRRQL